MLFVIWESFTERAPLAVKAALGILPKECQEILFGSGVPLVIKIALEIVTINQAPIDYVPVT